MASAGGRVARAGGQLAVRIVKPVQSTNPLEARIAVLNVYKDLQLMARKFWWDYNMHHMPLGFFRSVLKQQFVKNSHLQDIRVIDRLVGECRQHMRSIKDQFYNDDHVRNYLFKENIEAKPKDFLSKFLYGKE
ncbi:hypothetical protein WR25_07003 [Diploscapter pachys]|uniref:Uncharacterized protein n=1 Tax=Diploscapter pachys TaxID=2018661 RepID=A0A2A2LH86_9BILA|nr:hypothetical protein WR25_07003 [Diploscapter pachys]